MTTQLREELDALADTQTFSPDPSAWDRGRRARRNSRLARGAAGLAVLAVIVGVGVFALQPDRGEVQPAEVPDGAVPSRIDTRNAPFGTWPPLGMKSVAYIASGGFVLVDAEDGSYELFGPDDPSIAFTRRPALALSPDGWRLAWTAPDRIVIADLESGDITSFAHNGGRGAEVTELFWRDADLLRWRGTDDEGQDVAAEIDVTGPSESPSFSVEERPEVGGLISPDQDVIALRSDGSIVTAVLFLEEGDGPGGSTQSRSVDRPLPADTYPDGALVQPLGWAEDDQLVAIVDPPPSDITEQPRLAIFTSPDVPEAQWTWREFLPRLPPVESLSIAVDLIPTLDGDPDQELTHDFAASAASPDEGRGALPYALGGVTALLAGLVFIRMMQKRA